MCYAAKMGSTKNFIISKYITNSRNNIINKIILIYIYKIWKFTDIILSNLHNKSVLNNPVDPRRQVACQEYFPCCYHKKISRYIYFAILLYFFLILVYKVMRRYLLT